jgi:uncharacterized protein YcgI (DUF1989 family)
MNVRRPRQMSTVLDTTLEPGAATVLDVGSGALLELVQTDGGQVADVLSFVAEATSERLSMWMSCSVNRRWKLSTGDLLVSHGGRDLWTIEEDTVGEHYCGGGYCNPALNARWHGRSDVPTCETNFLRVLEPRGLGRGSFDGDTCFNAFMQVAYDPDSAWRIEPCPAGPGDRISLRAHADQVVAISNCPAVLTATNRGRTRPLRIRVTETTPAT